MPTNEAAVAVTNLREIQFPVSSETTSPTLNLSGALYCSGGALLYKGSAGTLTTLGAA